MKTKASATSAISAFGGPGFSVAGVSSGAASCGSGTSALIGRFGITRGNVSIGQGAEE
jgi:hypothetical protein